MADERDDEPAVTGSGSSPGAGPSGSTPPPHPFGAPDPERRHAHDSAPPPEGHERKRLFERAVPEIVKRVIERAVESGVEKLTELSDRPDALRNFVSDLRLPKEVLSDVYAQIDDTKNGLYRVVAKELRDVLQQTQIADEIAKVLTKLSFEIKTEIRFVPNDRSAEREATEEDDDPTKKTKSEAATGIRPKVTSEVTVKDRSGSDRRGR